MRAIGIKHLKNKLSEFIRIASRGESVLITDRDRVVAELGPPKESRSDNVTDAQLADAVRNGLITPAVLPPGVPVKAESVISFRNLMKEIEKDRGR